MDAEERNAICEELRRCQRHKMQFRRSRIMNENRLRAIVAGSLGYDTDLSEKKRQALFKQADKLIAAVAAGEEQHPLHEMITAGHEAAALFEGPEKTAEKEMVKFAKRLPVAEWVEQEEQRGFGFPSLATVIGEAGDLANYANPARLWKRMGCAPFESGGKTLMGSTWKSGSQGKLSGPEWEEFGYSPRRRSIAYVIGDCLIKSNKGPYRERYDSAKAAIQAAHPDYKPLRCHRHGMLLATKLVLKNLWIEWEPESRRAVPDFRHRLALA